MIAAEFHFLRPEWLLALAPALGLIILLMRQNGRSGGSEWAGLVDAHLLRHLTIQGTPGRAAHWIAAAFATGLIAAVLAMSGPTWKKIPTPAFRGSEPTVIVLSLAQSMNGTDLVPSRLGRASHKLRDMLDRAKDEDVGLVIYSDRHFVVAPLTNDADVIRQMLPELSTTLMPVLGNRLDLAIIEAHALLSRAGANAGRIVVLADDAGSNVEASLKAASDASDDGYNVNVLGVGTEAGATLQTATGQAIQTRDGQNVTLTLDTASLTGLANAGNGTFSLITADDRDLDAIFPDESNSNQAAGDQTNQFSDGWADAGYLLLLLPVFLAPLAFRRGVLLTVAFGLFFTGSLMPHQARASVWDDLWRTRDQQAQNAFDQGDFAAAAQSYTTPDRKAGALYRGGDYPDAASLYGADDYNRGNALAQSGAFEEALAAYDARLKAAPGDADAKFNRDIVAKLLEEQQQDEQEQQDQNEQQQDKPQQGEQDQQEASQQGEADQNDQPQQGQGGEPQQDANGGEQQSDGGQDPSEQSEGQQSAGQDGQSGDAKGSAGGESTPQTGRDSSAPSTADMQSAEEQQAGAEPNTAEPSQTGTPGSAAIEANRTDQGQSPEPSDPVEQQNQQAQSEAEATQDPSSDGQSGGFSQMMDRILGANGEPTEEEAGEQVAAGSVPVLNQAAEQQLRAVPDDPSGLLRARIRQHYSRLRAANQ